MAEPAHTVPACRPSEFLWQRIVEDYRQLRILQRQGRPAESARLLHDELPARILVWAEQDPADGVAQARRLEAMFHHEQQRLADVWLLDDLMESRLRTQLLPALSARIDAEIQQAKQRHAPIHAAPPAPTSFVAPSDDTSGRSTRVPAGDIPSIIDLILERERQSGARYQAA